MAETALFKIPNRYRLGFQQLAVGEEEVINRLISILDDLPPALSLGSIASAAAEQSGLTPEQAGSLLGAVISLYSLREDTDLSTQAIVSNISQALKDDEKLPDLSDEEIRRFEDRLSRLLELRGSLQTSAKAKKLLSEYKNIFITSRVMTDVRPVFKDDVKDGLAGVLIVHELKINHRTVAGDDEFFVALDSNDLRQLLEQVERALNKEESLGSFFRNAEVPYLEVGSRFEE